MLLLNFIFLNWGIYLPQNREQKDAIFRYTKSETGANIVKEFICWSLDPLSRKFSKYIPWIEIIEIWFVQSSIIPCTFKLILITVTPCLQFKYSSSNSLAELYGTIEGHSHNFTFLQEQMYILNKQSTGCSKYEHQLYSALICKSNKVIG